MRMENNSAKTDVGDMLLVARPLHVLRPILGMQVGKDEARVMSVSRFPFVLLHIHAINLDIPSLFAWTVEYVYHMVMLISRV